MNSRETQKITLIVRSCVFLQSDADSLRVNKYFVRNIRRELTDRGRFDCIRRFDQRRLISVKIRPVLNPTKIYLQFNDPPRSYPYL